MMHPLPGLARQSRLFRSLLPAFVLLLLSSPRTLTANLVGSEASAAAKGRALALAADAKDDGYVDLQVDLQMILRAANGRESQRDLRIKQLEVPEDGDKMLVIFDTPKAVRGTALLSYAHRVGEDDQWLYLPAIKRVKKIGSKNRSGPFLASEFAFEDLTPVEVDKYEHAFLRDTDCSLGRCHVLQRVPLDKHTGYSRQEVWLDTEELRVARIDYFDRRGELLKTLTVEGFAQYQGRYWRAAKMRMQNHRSGKSTDLLWNGYRFDTGLDADRDFSTNSLRRVR